MSHLKEDRKGLASAEKVGTAFAKAAGADSIKGLRALPAERIIEIFNHDPEGKKFRSQPNVDGWVLPAEVRRIFAEGRHNDVPVIVGSNANEMTSLTSPATVPKSIEEYRRRVTAQYGELAGKFDTVYPVKTEAEIRDAYLGSLRDQIFSLQMRSWARATASGRSRAYLYFFSHVPPNANSRLLGAYHAAEIAYVFGNLNRNNQLLTEADRKLSEIMSSYWVNFAASGDPNGPGLAKWLPYDLEREPYLDFGPTVELRHQLLKPQLDLIEEFQNRR
jgi:para-nitrobenzyl esterase